MFRRIFYLPIFLQTPSAGITSEGAYVALTDFRKLFFTCFTTLYPVKNPERRNFMRQKLAFRQNLLKMRPRFGRKAKRDVSKVAPVAQLDRVPGYEPGGRGFESYPAHQTPLKSPNKLSFGWAFLLPVPRGRKKAAASDAPENFRHPALPSHRPFNADPSTPGEISPAPFPHKSLTLTCPLQSFLPALRPSSVGAAHQLIRCERNAVIQTQRFKHTTKGDVIES